MTYLNLQTKISNEDTYISSGLRLKDGLFATFSKDYLILYYKNFSSEIIKFYYDKENYTDIKNVKQLKNGKILCCNEKLFVVNYDIKSKKIDFKIIELPKKENEEIEIFLDVVELHNGTILGITLDSIYKIKITDENNEFTPIYKIPEEWLVSWENKCFYNGNLDLYDLKNKKLLLHSHSYFVSQRCPRSYASISMESKIFQDIIFIIDLTDFKVIYTEYFPNIAKIVVLNNCFCVLHSNTIFIYNINDYKTVHKIEPDINFINKYNDNIIITLNKKKEIILYNLSDLNNIKSQTFFFKNMNRFYGINTFIFKFKSKKFAIIYYNKIYIVDFPGNFKFKPINPKEKNNIETNDEENKNKKKKFK